MRIGPFPTINEWFLIHTRELERRGHLGKEKNISTGGVTVPQYLQFCSGHSALPQKRKVINELMGALYLVSP